MTVDNSPSCSFDEDPSYTHEQSNKSLADQRADLCRDRQLRAARQVAQWNEEASTPLVTSRARFIALLEEARRHEIKAIQEGRCSRPHDDVVNGSLLVRDVNETYRKLIQEAKKLFDDRKNRGMGEMALRDMCNQATSSFASLYPWSDGITCRDIPQEHPAFSSLMRRNGVTVGESGLTTMTTFTVALSCSQMKLQASIELKEQRLQEYAHATTARSLEVQQAAPIALPRPLPPRPVCCSPSTP